jgi:hypothetical protein
VTAQSESSSAPRAYRQESGSLQAPRRLSGCADEWTVTLREGGRSVTRRRGPRQEHEAAERAFTFSRARFDGARPGPMAGRDPMGRQELTSVLEPSFSR